MVEYLFLDKTKEPSDEDLQKALAASYTYWVEIKQNIISHYGEIHPEWKLYDKRTGWTMKTMLKKRNLFFFKPYKGYFDLTFVFGDKAVSAIEQSDISERLITELRSSKKYMEGRVLTVTVSKKRDVQNIYKLLEIKIQN
jgi:hypothetical protein